jgi:hypothetical protein
MNTFSRQGVALIASLALLVPSVGLAQATTNPPASGGAAATRPSSRTFTLSGETTGLDAAAGNTGLANVCQGVGGSACIAQIVGNVINVVLSFSGLILLGFLIYGGLLWMTSGGDVEGVKKAKTMIQNAVIGILITSLSYVIASFVLTSLVTSLQGTPPASAPGAAGTGSPSP